LILKFNDLGLTEMSNVTRWLHVWYFCDDAFALFKSWSTFYSIATNSTFSCDRDYSWSKGNSFYGVISAKLWIIFLKCGQSWDDELVSVATNLVRTCNLQTNPRSLGPRPNTYNYDGITGYLQPRIHDISDQLRDAYNKPQFRHQVRKQSNYIGKNVFCFWRQKYKWN